MSDVPFMRLALRLARRGYGLTSPNPMVGAVLVKGGKIIGCGWHRRAGLPHAEIEALRHAEKRGDNPKGATLYVTLPNPVARMVARRLAPTLLSQQASNV